MSFAKIFESETIGQILVMKDVNDYGDPCVIVAFDPKTEGIEVLKSEFGFEDEERRNQVFADATLTNAESIVRLTLKEAGLIA